MPRPILSEFGPDASKPQAPRATRGGVLEAKTLPYSTPVGPTTFQHSGPGLANRNNYGNAGSQGKYSNPITTSGAPGIVRKGGENEGNEGSQDDPITTREGF
jgi:hypothetical protein